MGLEEKGVRYKPQNLPTIPKIKPQPQKTFIYPDTNSPVKEKFLVQQLVKKIMLPIF